MLLSEGAQIWWLSKHLADFGSPDYVGLFHYRRFMSLAVDKPIVNISQSQFSRELCALPHHLMFLIEQNGLDGLVFTPLAVTSDSEHSFTDIAS